MIEDIIAQNLRTRGGAAAIYLGKDVSLSYADLSRDIEHWAAWITQRSLPRHSRILLSIDDPYLFAVLFFALERCALTSVCSTPAMEPDAQRIAFLRVAAVISQRAPSVPSAVPWIKVGADWPMQLRNANLEPVPQPTRLDSDPICILLSSGTTGDVKKVLLNRRVFEIRVRDFENIRLMGSSRRALCIIPFYTVAGLSILFYSFNDGGSVTYATQGESWPELLRHRTFDAVMATPAQLQSILANLPSEWRPDQTLTVTVGGGAPSRELVRQIREKLTSNIYLAYGSTEVGVITQCHIDEVAGIAEAAGFPVPPTTVEIVDEKERPVGNGQAGQIRIAGANIVDGYTDDPSATVRYFRDGWYYPGDIGRLSEDGALTVLGRIDDLMMLNGAKLLPSIVEDRIAAAAPKVEAIAFAAIAPGDTGESLWIAAEEPLTPDAVKALAPFSKFALIRHSVIDVLPRNAMGKVDRVALRTLATAGALASRTATFVVRGTSLVETRKGQYAEGKQRASTAIF